MHSDPYPEIFITLEGEALMTHRDGQQVVRAADIVIVPADTPHKFISPGDVPLKQVEFHITDKMEQVEVE